MDEQVIYYIKAFVDKTTPYMSAPAPTSIAPRPARRCSSLVRRQPRSIFAGSLSQVLHNLNDKDGVYISSEVDITRDAGGRVEGMDVRRQCNVVEVALIEIELQDIQWP
jgi:hypothetical protein